MRDCEQAIPFRDFDGMWNHMPCGRIARRRLVLREAEVAAYIESLGGWDAYRRMMCETGEKHDDPGADPGRDKWGDSVVFLCEEHAAGFHDEAATSEGFEVLSDEAVPDV